ncbi:tetratricopeptide repeat protein [Rubrivirga marina]|uniref:tetratricopeptide repeat protein n=1 Tax=Rubrivirga marina TaxID=1196024 RepID=UPI00117B8EAE|nr:tetratricopeptide repeat protein [Rubrivirga marina]
MTTTDLSPEGFDGAPSATPEVLDAALRAFYAALDLAPSRALDRDRGAQEDRLLLENVAADTKATREALLADAEIPDALRTVLEQQAPDAAALARDGRPAEAVHQLQEHIRRIEDLGTGAGTGLRTLLDAHLLTLRLELGGAHARAGDHAAAAGEFAGLPDIRRLAPTVLPAVARLAYNARDARALADLTPRIPEGSVERLRAELWLAITRGDWTATLAALDALDAIETEDGTRLQARARALIELGRDPVEAVALLDRAWDAADTPLARLAVAAATADLVEGVIDREAEAPGLDRPATVQSASVRLVECVDDGDAPLVHAAAHTRASAWFGFLDDHERYDRHRLAFDAVELPDGVRERFVIDPALGAPALARLADDGVIDQATLHRVRALHHKASGDALREEASIREALDAGADGPIRSALIERLLDLRLGANDLPGAEALLDGLAQDDPMRPLFEAKVVLARHGRDAARTALRAVLNGRPRARPALRSLALLTANAARDAEGERRDELFADAVALLRRLNSLLPCRAHALMEAEIAASLGRTADALAALDRADVFHTSPASQRMRASVLHAADRLPEAAQALADAYDLDPTDPEAGSEAGRLWIEATRFDTAADLLARVAADHPDEPVIHANLGLALLKTSAPERRAQALAALDHALRLDPALPIPPFARMEAADAAGDTEAGRRAAADARRSSPTLTVATDEDVRESERLVSESGAVWLDMQGRPALEAFLRVHSDRAEAAHRLSQSDMAPFGGIATRPWTNWLAAVDAFRRGDGAAHPEAFTNRAPWPSESMMQPFGPGSDPLPPADGLLLDLTALLTLASLDALDEGLRAAHASFGRIVLYPGALADLRDEVGNLAGGFDWEGRQPYPETLALVERYALGPRPDDPAPDALRDAVPEPARTPLGNSADDVGLAVHLGADFVRQPSSFDEGDEELWGGRTWTSAEVLAALHRENRVGLSQARQMAEAAPETFGGWEAADPPPLPDLVVSGFLLTDWYKAGLLDLWTSRGAAWPALRVGPFALATLRGQTEGRARRQSLAERVQGALRTLDTLAAEGVVEPLARPPDADAPEDPISRLWDHATVLFDAAHSRGLHVWADDRALGFLLWSYDVPISGPEVAPQLRALRERYEGTGLLSTEMVLERSAGLAPNRAAALGWRLFEAGYRPLLGRLALRHLLAEYAHTFDADPFRRLLAAAGALDAFLPSQEILPAGRREPFLNAAAVPILDSLLGVAWDDPSLPDDERPGLGTAILDACWPLFEGPALRDALGLSVARLLLSRAVRARRDPDADDPADVGEGDPRAELWLATALAERLSSDDRAAVARAVEDMALDFYRGLCDRPLDVEGAPPLVTDEERIGAEIFTRRLAARTAWRRLTPLLRTPLLDDLAPVVRRVLALLAGEPAAGLTERAYRVGSGESGGVIRVDEEDIEAAAMRAIEAAVAGNAGPGSPVFPSRVHGTWNRAVPVEDREQEPSLPEILPIGLDVPALVLALRDHPVLQPAVVEHLARSLDHIDPPLRARVLGLRDDLLADDEAERELAVERLADAAVGSVSLDLERDPAHAATRLRSRSLEDLEAWLYAPTADPTPFDEADVVVYGDFRAPLSSLQTALLLTLDGSQSDGHFFPQADAALRAVTDGTVPSPTDALSAFAHAAETRRSSFSAVYVFLIALHLAARHSDVADGELARRPGDGGGSRALSGTDWLRRFAAEALGHRGEGSPLRDPLLGHAHSRVLRLAVHACSGPAAVGALFARAEGDADRVAAEWATAVLVASDRLWAFLADRYPEPVVAAQELDAACTRVGFVLGAPGRTGDLFNPLAVGPGLVDYERWLMLHALDQTWDALTPPAGLPLWWSTDAADALRAIAERPHEREAQLFEGVERNGLRSTLDRPPSAIAQSLLDRSAAAL